MPLVGPAAVGSLARAVQQRAAGSPGGDAYWFYVDDATPMFGLTDYQTVAVQLVPGGWYLAKATFEEWVLAVDDASGREGWVAREAVRRT